MQRSERRWTNGRPLRWPRHRGLAVNETGHDRLDPVDDAAQIAADEGDVARLDRDVGAGAHRDADLRLRQGRLEEAEADPALSDRTIILALAFHLFAGGFRIGLVGGFTVSVPIDATTTDDGGTRGSYAVDLQLTGRLASFGAPILRAQVKAQVREMIANLERELKVRVMDREVRASDRADPASSSPCRPAGAVPRERSASGPLASAGRGRNAPRARPANGRTARSRP